LCGGFFFDIFSEYIQPVEIRIFVYSSRSPTGQNRDIYGTQKKCPKEGYIPLDLIDNRHAIANCLLVTLEVREQKMGYMVPLLLIST
jgi:hypothetical protein